MPGKADIRKSVLEKKGAAQDFERRRYLKDLQALTGHDTIIYTSRFTAPKLANASAYYLSITTDDVASFMSAVHGLKADTLDLILHSPGGTLEAAEQIVQYLRSKYRRIRVIVPQNAMSAATMIACAADEIVMGRQSALGPIYPQITLLTQNGQFTVAAHSLLSEFAQARAEVIKDPRVSPLWVCKIKDYPPGILHVCQQTSELAIERVEFWLASYMLHGEENASITARRIAEWLGSADKHKTHGRPIGPEQALEAGLKVKRLEDDQDLQDAVLSVFHACAVTFEVTKCLKIVENHEGKGVFVMAS